MPPSSASTLAAYINSDGNARGFPGTIGAATLTTLVQRGLPRRHRSGRKGGQRRRPPPAPAHCSMALPTSNVWPAKTNRCPSSPSTTGTDYSPFLVFLGVPALDTGYGGEEEYGVYHTSYDSFAHFTRFVDPGFRYGVALSQTAGPHRAPPRRALTSLPLDFVPFYAPQLSTASGSKGSSGAPTACAKRLRRPTSASPMAPTPSPTIRSTPCCRQKPSLPFRPSTFHAPSRPPSPTSPRAPRPTTPLSIKPPPREHTLSAATRTELDGIILHAERAFLRPEGQPGRPWYLPPALRLPNLSTGSIAIFPTVLNAIDQRAWQDAAEGIASDGAGDRQATRTRWMPPRHCSTAKPGRMRAQREEDHHGDG